MFRTARDWYKKQHARWTFRAAKKSIAAGDTALAAAQFDEAAARASEYPTLLTKIHATAGQRLREVGAIRGAARHFLGVAEALPHQVQNLRRLASVNYELGDRDGEIKAWRLVLKTDPHDAKAHHRLAKLLFMADPWAAYPHLKVVAGLSPEFIDNWRRLAVVWAQNGNVAAEAKAWRRVADLAPEDLEPHRRLVELLWNADDSIKALPHLEVLAETSPDESEFWRRLAHARGAAGNSDGEVKAWREFLKRNPDAGLAHRRLGEIFLERDTPHKAILHLRSGAIFESKDGKLLQGMASACRSVGDLDGEIEALVKLFETVPGSKEIPRRLAWLFSQKGRHEEAVAALRQAGVNGASDLAFRREFATALMSANCAGDQIIKAWRAVLEFDQRDLTAHEHLAHCFSRAQQWSNAIPHLRFIVKAKHKDLESRRRLALALDMAGTEQEKVTAWRDVLRLDDRHLESHKHLADLLEVTDAIAARVHIEFLTENAPGSIKAWRRLAYICRSVSDLVGETTAWLRIVDLKPDNYEAHYRLAKNFHTVGVYDKASSHLEICIEENPTDRSVWEALADVREQVDDRKGALEAWRYAATLGELDAFSSVRLADLCCEAGQIDEAIDTLRSALLVQPQNLLIWQRLAWACHSLGDIECETDAWLKILELDAENMEAHKQLSEIFIRVDDAGQAVLHLEKWLEQHHSDKNAWLKVAIAKEQRGDKAGALEAWVNVTALRKLDSTETIRVADLCISTGRHEEAIENLQTVLDARPGDSGILSRLVQVYQSVGDLKAEKEIWLLLIEHQTEHHHVHKRLSEVYDELGDYQETETHLNLWLSYNNLDMPSWERLAKVREKLSDKLGALEAWRRAAALGDLDMSKRKHVADLCHSVELYDEAADNFSSILAEHPDDEPILRRLARSYQASNRREDEISVWKRLLKFLPDDSRAHFRLGDLYYDCQHFEKAIPHLKRAAKERLANMRLLDRFAKACRASGDGKNEIMAWRLVIEQEPENTEAHRRLGDLLYGVKQFAAAAAHLKIAVSIDVENMRLLRRLAKAYRGAGDVKKELHTWIRFVERQPGDLAVHKRLSLLLRNRGDCDGAITHLTAAIKIEPTSVKLWRALAKLYATQDNQEGEIDALKKVLEIDPENTESHRRCGELLFNRQNYREATRHIQFVSKALRTDKKLRHRLARCLRVVGEVEEELSVMHEIVALDELDYAAHQRIAAILLAKREAKEALSHLQICVEMAPDNVDDQRSLAHAFAMLPSYDEAVNAWKRLFALSPKDQEARRNLAEAALKAHRNEEAETFYEALIVDCPAETALWLNYAQAAGASRGSEAAIDILRAAIENTEPNGELYYTLAEHLIESNHTNFADVMHKAWTVDQNISRYAKLCKKLEDHHQTDDALAEYNKLMEDAPNAAEGWFGAGSFMERTNQHRLAATYLGRAYDLTGEKIYQKRWMHSLLKSGAYEAVEDNCRALLEEYGDDPGLLSHLSGALLGQKRFKDAHRLVSEFYFQPDALEREALLRYITNRAPTLFGDECANGGEYSPSHDLFLKAERLQARDDLVGASRIYRKIGVDLHAIISGSPIEDVNIAGPNFIVIGAPCCGATWIKNNLSNNPQIYFPRGEQAYFSRQTHYSPHSYVERFMECFQGRVTKDSVDETGRENTGENGAPVFGDASTDYLTISNEAIELCAALYPNLKIICTVREPVERAWSHLTHEDLAARTTRCYIDSDGNIQQWLSDILEKGRYGDHLKRWAQWFSPEQFLVVSMEHINTDPFEVLDRIQKFIGAEHFDYSSKDFNDSKLVNGASPCAPSEEVRQFLTNVYADETYDAEALQRSLGKVIRAPHQPSKAA